MNASQYSGYILVTLLAEGEHIRRCFDAVVTVVHYKSGYEEKQRQAKNDAWWL
jgi:hypothetical protein